MYATLKMISQVNMYIFNMNNYVSQSIKLVTPPPPPPPEPQKGQAEG